MVCGLIPPEPAQASRVSFAGDRLPVQVAEPNPMGLGGHPRVLGKGRLVNNPFTVPI
jgi:hypothetical protein